MLNFSASKVNSNDLAPCFLSTPGYSIAMPRALWYHIYPGLWSDFFSHLGFQVHLSSKTVRKTVECAARISESEHCLPLKLHDAHLHEIVEKADWVFIPRILSTLPRHIACPKLGALPDCARAQFGDTIEVMTVEVNEAKFPLRRSLCSLGRSLGARRRRVRQAADAALKKMQKRRAAEINSTRSTESEYFLILAHPYNLNDHYMSGPVLSKLDLLNVSWRTVNFSQRDIAPKILNWDACSIMYHTLENLDAGQCRGVIQLSSFNCGCDSVAMPMFQRLLREKEIPYMTLVLDENEAQAGIDTRLEAFVDSVEWKRKGISSS